jgi:methionine--tRNA ligase beta chain
MAEETKPTEEKTTEEISFDYFEKVDLRVGKIIEAAAVPASKKLIQIQVDFGTEKRQCIAGLLKYYKPEELLGKKCVFLLNLQRRMIAGLESQAMILAAEDAAGVVSVLQPEKDTVLEGSKIG